MIKRSRRLSTKQFSEVMEKGKIYHSPLFLMRVLEHGKQEAESKEKEVRSKESGGIKIAAVAPKKIAPTAVLRNRIRRRMYEAVQAIVSTSVPPAAQPTASSMIPGTHAIIFAKTTAITAEFEGMAADLKTLFSKARIGV